MTTFKTMLLGATALTMMAGAALAQSNDAYSEQSGNNNETFIDQQSSGRGHDADAYVTGNRNFIEIDQDSNTNSSGAATVEVGGDRNDVDVDQNSFQSGNAQTQTVDIYIDGDRNDVTTLQQYGTASEDNVITIDIMGNDDGSRNTVDIQQAGNGDTSTTTIWGDRNEVDVFQGAGAQTATIYIDGTSGDDEGDNNTVSVVQNHSGAFDGSLPGNVADIQIWGDNNNSSDNDLDLGFEAGLVEQAGRGNTVDLNVGALGIDSDNNAFSLTQNGDSNSILADILGNDNTTQIAQSGDGNSSNSMQIGDSNAAFVAQNGMENISVISQVGYGNTASVVQGASTGMLQ